MSLNDKANYISRRLSCQEFYQEFRENFTFFFHADSDMPSEIHCFRKSIVSGNPHQIHLFPKSFRKSMPDLFSAILNSNKKNRIKIRFSGIAPYLQNHILKHIQTTSLWLSPRPISNSQLHALLHFHLCPIYLVVSKGSYFFRMGYLILRGASRLDAFSVYPFQTWLPGRGLSSPTGPPAVRPSRSSRTKDSSSQISSACAG